MIAELSGTLVDRGKDTLVVETGGVGYEVLVTQDLLEASALKEKKSTSTQG